MDKAGIGTQRGHIGKAALVITASQSEKMTQVYIHLNGGFQIMGNKARAHHAYIAYALIGYLRKQMVR